MTRPIWMNDDLNVAEPAPPAGLWVVVLQDDDLDGPARYEVVVRRQSRSMTLHFDYGDGDEEVVEVEPGEGNERFYFEHRFPREGQSVRVGGRLLTKWNWAQLAWVDNPYIPAQAVKTYHTSLASEGPS